MIICNRSESGIRRLLSKDKQVARDIADVGLSIEDVEDIDSHIKLGRFKEAQDRLLEICGVEKTQLILPK